MPSYRKHDDYSAVSIVIPAKAGILKLLYKIPVHARNDSKTRAANNNSRKRHKRNQNGDKVSTCFILISGRRLGRDHSNYIIFTSISTPDGNESDVNDSINLGTGLMISIKRLCTRISNCSRASL